jgi:hypothetical protein
MSPLVVVLGFAPWILYLVVVGLAGAPGVPLAALLALALAVGLIVTSVVQRQSPRLLAVAAAVIFACYGLASLVAPGVDPFLADYGRAVAALALAATILALLPVLPFTEQFARESVPRQYWSSPRFRALNQRVSAVWALAIGGSGIAGALAAALVDSSVAHRPLLGFLLRIGVPVVLLIGAMRYTRRATAAGGSEAPGGRPVTDPGDTTDRPSRRGRGRPEERRR